MNPSTMSLRSFQSSWNATGSSGFTSGLGSPAISDTSVSVFVELVEDCLSDVDCCVGVADEHCSVHFACWEERFSQFLLGFADQPGCFQGLDHSLVSLTIVPVPNLTTLFGLTSTLSLTCWNFFPSYRYVPFLLSRSFSM